MRRTIQWVLSTTLICGASLLISCDKDKEDNTNIDLKETGYVAEQTSRII